jgi:hypothetical protein
VPVLTVAGSSLEVSTAKLVLQGCSHPLAANSGRPDHVDADDVVVGVLGLEVLHEVVVLLVGRVGLLLEGHLLVRVGGVPLLDWSAGPRCCCPCRTQ